MTQAELVLLWSACLVCLAIGIVAAFTALWWMIRLLGMMQGHLMRSRLRGLLAIARNRAEGWSIRDEILYRIQVTRTTRELRRHRADAAAQELATRALLDLVLSTSVRRDVRCRWKPSTGSCWMVFDDTSIEHIGPVDDE